MWINLLCLILKLHIVTTTLDARSATYHNDDSKLANYAYLSDRFVVALYPVKIFFVSFFPSQFISIYLHPVGGADNKQNLSLAEQ